MPLRNIKLVQSLIVKHQAEAGKAGFLGYALVSVIRTLSVQKYVLNKAYTLICHWLGSGMLQCYKNLLIAGSNLSMDI